MAANLPLDDPALCACYRIRRTSREVTRYYDDALASSGLLTTQFSMLTTVQRSGPITVKDIAERLGMEASTAARNSRVLVAEGLLERVRGDDRRERRVQLTTSGEKRLKAAHKRWSEAQRRLIREFGEQPFRDLLRALRRLVPRRRSAT